MQTRLVLLVASLVVAGSPAGPSAQRSGDEVWSESGLRVVSKSLQLEPSGDRLARIRLIAAGSDQITVEASTFMMGGDQSGVVIKSLGPATVMAPSRGRRMEVDSIEVWLSADGWGYLKAVRRVGRQ